MVFFEGTLSSDPAGAATVKAAIEAELTALAGWSSFDTGVVGATGTTFDVWLSAAASNSLGVDWYLFLGTDDATETTLYVSASNDWDTVGEFSNWPVYSSYDNFSVTTDGRPILPLTNLPLSSTSWYKPAVVIDTTLDYYRCSLTNDYLIVLTLDDSDHIWVGHYNRYFTTGGAANNPLIAGGFASSVGDTSQNMRPASHYMWHDGRVGSVTHVDDRWARASPTGLLIERADTVSGYPLNADTSALTSRHTTNTVLIVEPAHLGTVDESVQMGTLPGVFYLGWNSTGGVRLDEISINGVRYILAVVGTSNSLWVKAV